MYLCRRLVWGEESCAIAGVIEADAVMHPRPQGRGVVRLRETARFPWRSASGNGDIAAREFHYAGLENLADDAEFGFEVLRGAGIDGSHDGIVAGNPLASFCHLRDTQANRWVERFVAYVRSAKT